MTRRPDSNRPRHITFVTGTRADYGKLKPLMFAAQDVPDVRCSIFATGMHMLNRYGSTVNEVREAGAGFDIHSYMNQGFGEPPEIVLANTIHGLSRYLQEHPVDMLVVHGDRPEALAAAAAGSLRHTLVAHVEGGEVSGTIDGVLRHSISKLAQVHLVANEQAASRLRQLGEPDAAIFVIGSPDIDVMASDNLPTLDVARARYDISFERFGLLLFHPVTFEAASMGERTEGLVDAVLASSGSWIVVYPNNDPGSDAILRAYKRLEDVRHIRVFPSLRFEYFLSFLRHAECIVGNSSAGIREAPVYGVPSVDIGERQRGRFTSGSIIQTGYDRWEIGRAIARARAMGRQRPNMHFGSGESAIRFKRLLADDRVWSIRRDKEFVDR